MKAAPKFKVGDIVEVVSVPKRGNKKYIGYQFTIKEACVDSFGDFYYIYLDDFLSIDCSFCEHHLELAEICKSPLWRALE